jgi:hypothetical protein
MQNAVIRIGVGQRGGIEVTAGNGIPLFAATIRTVLCVNEEDGDGSRSVHERQAYGLGSYCLLANGGPEPYA